MRYLKTFAERISARDPNRQSTEAQICIVLMNHFSALGLVKIIREA